MLNVSRIDIYNYLYGLFFGTVTENVYSMNEPQELTDDDVGNGFIVINVGDIYDNSEFNRDAYGEVRCYVTAYVPPISRGRLDVDKYKEFEDGINTVIELASETSDEQSDYYIQEGSVLSSDMDETSNANNAYYTFIKSFIVVIDKKEDNN